MREADQAERWGTTAASVASPGLARLRLNPRWGEKPDRGNNGTCKGPEAAPGVLEGQVGQETHVAGGEHVKGREGGGERRVRPCRQKWRVCILFRG